MTAPTAAKPPLSQKIRAAITRHATELAEAPELSELFWLCDPEDGNLHISEFVCQVTPGRPVTPDGRLTADRSPKPAG